MVGTLKKGLILLLLPFLAAHPLSAGDKSEQKDSLIRLMKGSSLSLVEENGNSFRKAIDATFLHNGTYLICDTALWDVDNKVINAWGHVQVIQDETILTSEKLIYLIEDNLAQFRGALVQLQNKKENTLRTRNLDYNTKDSVAVFRSGASMKDKDGQIIESMDGTYSSQSKLFTFRRKVEMFTDSVFVKTEKLDYDSDAGTAFFLDDVDFWKDSDMLSAGSGWYDRRKEVFFFTDNVHGLGETQEVWADTLYFYRDINDLEMHSNVQIQDTSRNVAAMSNYAYYNDSTAKVVLRQEAAVSIFSENAQNGRDTLYIGGDELTYRTVPMCEVDEDEIARAQSRREGMFIDPVGEYRAKAAEAALAAQKAAEEEAAKNDPALAAKLNAQKLQEKRNMAAAAQEQVESASEPVADFIEPAADSLGAVSDSLGVGTDSLAVSADTLAVPKDSTKVGFVTGLGNVLVFRKDIQARCDSLVYCDIDSIARLHIAPMVWNEGNRQYNSDSLFVLVKDGGVDRASLLSNAFLMIQEDSTAFDQIKGTEVMAYFDTTTALTRFDALGDATAMFYLKEDDALATVNKVACKMLSATLKDSEVERVYYYDNPKNDAYPRAQLSEQDAQMKGFNWTPELRPAGKEDITSLTIIPTERSKYESHPHTEFRYTETYFPGYMKSVYRSIEVRDSLRNLPPSAEPEPSEPEVSDSSAVELPSEELAVSSADSLQAPDAVVAAAADTAGIQPDGPEEGSESEVMPAPSDSTTAVLDTVVVSEKSERMLAIEKRMAQMEAQQARRDSIEAVRIAAREAKWAVLDSLDSLKTAEKELQILQKKRQKTRNMLWRKYRKDKRDQAKLDKYVIRYEKRKARKERGATAGSDAVFGNGRTADDRPVLSGGRISGPEGGPSLRGRNPDSDNSGRSDQRP